MSPRLFLDLDMHVWQLDGQTADGTPCVPGGPTIDQIAERFGPLVEITGEYESNPSTTNREEPAVGLFTPKYPQGAAPPRKESRADRKSREGQERLDRQTKQHFKDAERASKERSAHFWADYEQRNGVGSVDWS